ncbi:hypothetical protein RvY_16551-2 [Ramazzottius varieornatus]|uniref:Uncharacterized protein n=1 Tax=Ramazzottius varieornatus TaxID=947166 RepID=A0A1D1W058_RAMVA|nr:hypothetical protein RvY_16551-2 [Ramazzottius varieornatus]
MPVTSPTCRSIPAAPYPPLVAIPEPNRRTSPKTSTSASTLFVISTWRPVSAKSSCKPPSSSWKPNTTVTSNTSTASVRTLSLGSTSLLLTKASSHSVLALTSPLRLTTAKWVYPSSGWSC